MDLLNIARTTLGSKILAQHKDFFAELAVDAVLRLRGSGNLQAIQILKVQGKTLRDSFLDEGVWSTWGRLRTALGYYSAILLHLRLEMNSNNIVISGFILNKEVGSNRNGV